MCQSDRRIWADLLRDSSRRTAATALPALRSNAPARLEGQSPSRSEQFLRTTFELRAEQAGGLFGVRAQSSQPLGLAVFCAREDSACVLPSATRGPSMSCLRDVPSHGLRRASHTSPGPSSSRYRARGYGQGDRRRTCPSRAAPSRMVGVTVHDPRGSIGPNLGQVAAGSPFALASRLLVESSFA